MDDLQNAVKRRYPLLTSLRIFHSLGDSEDLMAFMGVLLAAMEGSHGSSFCFVFPRKSGIAPLSAVLYALGRFAFDFPRLAEQYARQSFRKGQRVRLIPEGKVFIFGGVWPGLETRFRLELLKEKAAFTWPVSEILRIEPTLRKIPKGEFADADKARRETPLSTLDCLIGTRTFGNNSLAVNHVLYLGGRSEVEEFLAATALTGSAHEGHATIARLIAPGFIDESGAIKHQDNYQAAGEPLMAISSRLENVAAACSLAPQDQKLLLLMELDGSLILRGSIPSRNLRISSSSRNPTRRKSCNSCMIAAADSGDSRFRTSKWGVRSNRTGGFSMGYSVRPAMKRPSGRRSSPAATLTSKRSRVRWRPAKPAWTSQKGTKPSRFWDRSTAC